MNRDCKVRRCADKVPGHDWRDCAGPFCVMSVLPDSVVEAMKRGKEGEWSATGPVRQWTRKPSSANGAEVKRDA